MSAPPEHNFLLLRSLHAGFWPPSQPASPQHVGAAPSQLRGFSREGWRAPMEMSPNLLATSCPPQYEECRGRPLAQFQPACLCISSLVSAAVAFGGCSNCTVRFDRAVLSPSPWDLALHLLQAIRGAHAPWQCLLFLFRCATLLRETNQIAPLRFTGLIVCGFAECASVII